jgi:DNA polymerase
VHYSLNGDFETRGVVDLATVGARVYARHPMTRALCFNYSIRKGPVQRWRIWAGQPMPADLKAALADPECVIEAWNAAFERLIFWHVLKIQIPYRRFKCTMARARSMALPGKLELCARALAMPVQKMDSSIMLKWCKPLPDGSWAQDPAEYEQLLDYCDGDVETEIGLGDILRDLEDWEWEDYWISEEINDRGIPVDLELAAAAQRYAKDELAEICARLNVLTQGHVSTPKQFQRIKKWLAEHLPDELYEGLFLGAGGALKDKVSLDSAAREALLNDDNADILVGDVREFVELVHDGGRASTAKFAAMQARGVNEARVYGAYVFNGAGQTGRFSATGVQPHNLIRAKLENIDRVVEGILRSVSKQELQDIASYRPDGTFVFDKTVDRQLTEPYNILTILGRALKAAIIADEGKTLLCGDWKSIEAVVNPWLSQENSASELLDYFAAGGDLYIRQAALTYGVHEGEVTPGQRQAGGKVPVLSMGFLGGAGALMRMARAYNVSLDLDTAETLKRVWRETNPWAQRFGTNCEIAAYQAVRNPETEYRAGRLAYFCAQDVLWCLSPAGGLMAYPFPKISLLPNKWGDEQEVVTCMKGSFHPKKGANYWPRMKLWAGILLENPTQHTAAMLLRWAIRELHGNGWPLIGTTHDELIEEIEEAELAEAAAVMRDVMTTGPDWAAGLPLRADISAGPIYGQTREIAA